MFDIGMRVIVIVPSGPNVGQETARGIIVGTKCSRIDGRTYFVREADGNTVEYSAAWLVRDYAARRFYT